MTDNRMTLTVEEAAEILGISRALAYALVKKEQLPGLKLGRRLVVPRRALERLLQGDTTTTGDSSRTSDPRQ